MQKTAMKVFPHSLKSLTRPVLQNSLQSLVKSNDWKSHDQHEFYVNKKLLFSIKRPEKKVNLNQPGFGVVSVVGDKLGGSWDNYKNTISDPRFRKHYNDSSQSNKIDEIFASPMIHLTCASVLRDLYANDSNIPAKSIEDATRLVMDMKLTDKEYKEKVPSFLGIMKGDEDAAKKLLGKEYKSTVRGGRSQTAPKTNGGGSGGGSGDGKGNKNKHDENKIEIGELTGGEMKKVLKDLVESNKWVEGRIFEFTVKGVVKLFIKALPTYKQTGNGFVKFHFTNKSTWTDFGEDVKLDTFKANRKEYLKKAMQDQKLDDAFAAYFLMSFEVARRRSDEKDKTVTRDMVNEAIEYVFALKDEEYKKKIGFLINMFRGSFESRKAAYDKLGINDNRVENITRKVKNMDLDKRAKTASPKKK